MSEKLRNLLQSYSGIAGVMVLWLGIGSGMHIANLSFADNRPLSHLGITPSTDTIFASALLISSALFITFAYFVRRTYQVHNRFIIYFLIGQFGQVITALVPYGAARHKLIHTIGAFTLAISLPLLIRAFTASQVGKPHHQLFVYLLRTEQLSFLVGMGIFIFTMGIAPLGQSLPAIAFHAWILTVSILAFKK